MKAHTPLVSELAHFNYSTPPGGFHWPWHLHPFHQFDAILAGRVTIFLEKRRPVHARAGDGLFIPPLVRHAYESACGFRQASFKVYLSPACWARLGSAFRKVRLANALCRTLDSVGMRFRSGAPLAHAQAVAAATLCLGEMAQAAVPAESVLERDDLLPAWWPLLERIARDPHGGWTVEDLARRCHLSPDHFTRRFRRLFKRTPQQYLLEARMRAAAGELLREPARPIKEIAAAARYASVHGFTRAFKLAFGIAPAAYRRSPVDF